MAFRSFNIKHFTFNIEKLLFLQFFNLLLQVVEFLVHVRQTTEDSLRLEVSALLHRRSSDELLPALEAARNTALGTEEHLVADSDVTGKTHL